jgi:ADP-ribose pyrophosphatase YjhB (NUDIX family)
MNDNKHPLSQEEFDDIYSKVPRLTVEIIVRNKDGETYLTKRAIEPCKGLWHLPGGTVRFGEPLIEAVKRIALRELGIRVMQAKNEGYIEYPGHYQHGLDSPVGIVFVITEFTGDVVASDEAINSGWFKKLPYPMHDDQDVFLLNNKYFVE